MNSQGKVKEFCFKFSVAALMGYSKVRCLYIPKMKWQNSLLSAYFESRPPKQNVFLFYVPIVFSIFNTFKAVIMLFLV